MTKGGLITIKREMKKGILEIIKSEKTRKGELIIIIRKLENEISQMKSA